MCLDLIRQHEADGALPTNGRFLFYELEQAGVVPKYYLDANGRKAPRQPAADISDAYASGSSARPSPRSCGIWDEGHDWKTKTLPQ